MANGPSAEGEAGRPDRARGLPPGWARARPTWPGTYRLTKRVPCLACPLGPAEVAGREPIRPLAESTCESPAGPASRNVVTRAAPLGGRLPRGAVSARSVPGLAVRASVRFQPPRRSCLCRRAARPAASSQEPTRHVTASWFSIALSCSHSRRAAREGRSCREFVIRRLPPLHRSLLARF